STIYSIFTQAWQLSIIDEIESKSLNVYYKEVSYFFITTVVFLTVFVTLLSILLGRYIFGDNFIDSINYISLLTLSIMYGGISVFIGMVFSAKKDTTILFVSTTIGAIVNILLGILLIPVWGIYGATFASFLGYFTVWVIR